jgi:hypothetical protein
MQHADGHPAAHFNITPQTIQLMNISIRPLLSLLALAALFPQTVSAQGSLTPPAGVPAPVMKTLQEVHDKAAAAEARTPLIAGQPGVAIDANGTITISQPGSYFLTGNRTITTAGANGIVFASADVTLDLNGFSLICTAVNGGDAIQLGGHHGACVRNGHIVGATTTIGANFTLAGWGNGITTSAGVNSSLGTRVCDVSVRGVRSLGINIGYGGSSVEHCNVHTCGDIGIYATSVLDSTVRRAGGHGIFISSFPDGGSVSNCFGESIGVSTRGIDAFDGAVSNSQGIAAGGSGLAARVATNCSGTSTSGSGLAAQVATNCTGTSTSGTGLQADNATNCTGTSTSGSFGLITSGTASFCRGTRTGGTAISATIAIGCTTGGGTITSSQKHLGTP